MNLVESLEKKLSILDKIEQDDGEILPNTELELAHVEKQIVENVDKMSRYYSFLQKDLTDLPAQVRHFARKLQEKLEKKKQRFNSYVIPVLEKTGSLKTPFSSMTLVKKQIKFIVIDDFELVAKTYPESLTETIDDDQSCKTIRISKSYLEKQDTQIGFRSCTKESIYILNKHLGDF